MANPVCTPNTLLATAKCFSGSVLDSNKQRAMKIYFMAAQLAAIGGTNYLGHLSTTLVTDSRCKETLYPDQRDTIRLAVEFNNANAAGAALSTNIETLMQAIACLQNVPAEWMEVMEIHLRCALGYGHAYPQ